MPKKIDKKRLILLDSHAIIHRAYHALPEFSASSTGEPTGALYGLVAMLIKMVQELKPDYIVAAFDLSGPTFRHQAAQSYKAGRPENDENLEIQLKRSLDIFEAFNIPVYSKEGFEADDIIGTIVEKMKIENSKLEIIIASGDMDTMQLIDNKKVQVYTLKKGLNDTILYDEKKVIERFGFPPEKLIDYKGLRGDPSDNIIGVKGVGEKTATELIQKFGTIEDIYKKLKKNKADIPERMKKILLENEEEALFSKTLATIRTDAPINFKLPPEWSPNFNLEKILELFKTLGFRTLSERVKRMAKKLGSDVEVPKPTENLFASSQEEKELCLMLWIIDSNIVAPTLEDVFNFTKTTDIGEARKALEEEMDKRKVRAVFEKIEKPLMPVVEKMNETGVKIDKEVLNDLSQTYHKELNRLKKAIWKEAGEEFNINSPKALSEILFTKLGLAGKGQKKTPGGALSTKESELEKLREKSPIISHILDYRELSKLLSTYIDAIPPQLDKSSRLHSTFSQMGAVTGRMSSNNPNLQNIPNKTELGRAIRKAFVPEKGCKLVSLDYSQIELRLAAIFSQDKKLIEIFKSGKDVHKAVAERIGIERRQAKVINFGILYGMGVNALKVNLGAERREAQEFYNEYFKTFTGLAQYLDKVKVETARREYTETLFGRRRYFSGFKSPLPFIRASAERMAINAPLQGTQADIIKIAMTKIDEHIKIEKHEDDMRMILQVHDELVFEVKNNLVSEAVKHFKKIMETIISKEQLHSVPIVAEAHVGDNWGEMQRVDL
ncbi:MAG: DNA polymerase [Patescibacteria group bacterium]